MINVSSWSIRNPIPAILLFLLLTLAGLMGFRAMKIQNMPDIDLPMVIVSASLPGAAPAQLETEVARKIENSVAALQGVKHIYTSIQDGSVSITVEFRLEKPTQEGLDDVRDHLEEHGEMLAKRLLESHRRVRQASADVVRGLKVTVEPVADILGVFVFVPPTGGTK